MSLQRLGSLLMESCLGMILSHSVGCVDLLMKLGCCLRLTLVSLGHLIEFESKNKLAFETKDMRIFVE